MKKLLLFSAFIALLACSGTKSGGQEPPVTPQDPITEYFANEIRPAKTADCFAGAYYHKEVTSKDSWEGITAQVILPRLQLDSTRMNPKKPNQCLDNPSIYFGGNAGGQETDLGMSLEQTYADGPRTAFRPFLRRAPHSASGQPSDFTNAPNSSNYYWYSGDTITMTMQIVANGIVRFTVEGAGKKYVSADYACNGYMLGAKVEFKRVNAIDQVSNEGKPVQATKTKILESKWLYTKLLRRDAKNNLLQVNMHSGRYTDMRCPDVKYFVIEATDEQKKIGSETVTIDGGK